MNKIQKLLILNQAAASGITLPYTFDPATQAKPSWLGDTWAVSGGVLLNVPLAGSDLLVGGDMEGTYTSGLNDALTKSGTPTISEDTTTPHGGTSAQVFAAGAQYEFLRFATVTPSANKWYEFGGYAKRASGTGVLANISLTQSGGAPQAQTIGDQYNDAAYTLYRLVKHSKSTNALTPHAVYEIGTSNFATVHLDDYYLKLLDETTLINTYDFGAADVIVKVKLTWSRSGIGGVIARANADATSYLALYYYAAGDGASVQVWLEQNLAGTLTFPRNGYTNTGGVGSGAIPLNTEWLELRLSGNTAQVFHADAQVGADAAIDASLASNTRHGYILSEGVNSKLFFVGAN